MKQISVTVKEVSGNGVKCSDKFDLCFSELVSLSRVASELINSSTGLSERSLNLPCIQTGIVAAHISDVVLSIDSDT